MRQWPRKPCLFGPESSASSRLCSARRPARGLVKFFLGRTETLQHGLSFISGLVMRAQSQIDPRAGVRAVCPVDRATALAEPSRRRRQVKRRGRGRDERVTFWRRSAADRICADLRVARAVIILDSVTKTKVPRRLASGIPSGVIVGGASGRLCRENRASSEVPRSRRSSFRRFEGRNEPRQAVAIPSGAGVFSTPPRLVTRSLVSFSDLTIMVEPTGAVIAEAFTSIALRGKTIGGLPVYAGGSIQASSSRRRFCDGVPAPIESRGDPGIFLRAREQSAAAKRERSQGADGVSIHRPKARRGTHVPQTGRSFSARRRVQSPKPQCSLIAPIGQGVRQGRGR